MHRAWLAAAFVLLATAASACGSPPPAAPPVTPAPPDPHNPSTAPPSASTEPDVVGDNPAKPRGRKPFPIHSSCPDVVTIVFGDDPKAQGAGRRTIASNASIEGPRDAEGKQTVSLLDDKGEPIAKVHVNRGMKQLEIGRSCRTLDAH